MALSTLPVHNLFAQSSSADCSRGVVRWVDKHDESAVYTDEFIRTLRRKHHWMSVYDYPPHLRKIGYGPVQDLVLLIEDQRLSEEDLLSHNMFRRFKFAEARGIRVDSLARILLRISARLDSIEPDSIRLVGDLRRLGVDFRRPSLMRLVKSRGAVLEITGYFPLYSLEEIARIPNVGHIELPSLVFHDATVALPDSDSRIGPVKR